MLSRKTAVKIFLGSRMHKKNDLHIHPLRYTKPFALTLKNKDGEENADRNISEMKQEKM